MGTFLDSVSKSTVETDLHISEVVLLLSGLVLFLGIWGEYRKGEKWQKYLAAFQIMVLAGIGVELIADGGVFLFSENLQRLEGSDIQALDKKAEEAQRKSELVSGRADQLAQTLQVEQDRADKLTDRMGVLSAQLNSQSPRWRLLENNKEKFIRAVRPFVGQPITVLDCGLNPEPEAYRLAQDILNFIGTSDDHAARWRIGYKKWDRCGPGGGTSYGGNLLATNAGASDTVKRAKKALYDALNTIGISTVQLEIGPPPQQLFEQYFGPSSPQVLAEYDAQSVFLLIGTNPMFDVSGFHNPGTSRK